MPVLFTARSISRPVLELLNQPALSVRVLALWPKVCDLVASDGQLVALVAPDIGDGPPNVVLSASPNFLDRSLELVEGTRVRLEGGHLFASQLAVKLTGAKLWEPCPDWATLRREQAAIQGRLARVASTVLRQAPPESLLALLFSTGHATAPTEAALVALTRRAAEALQAGWTGDEDYLQEAAQQLAGLGTGLTPSGDDFLSGAMLAAWLSHPRPESVCHPLVQAAVPHTTTLSAALLRAAGTGQCTAAWHRLLAALATGQGIEGAVADVLSHGATSGADTLAGFLYLMQALDQ